MKSGALKVVVVVLATGVVLDVDGMMPGILKVVVAVLAENDSFVEMPDVGVNVAGVVLDGEAEKVTDVGEVVVVAFTRATSFLVVVVVLARAFDRDAMLFTRIPDPTPPAEILVSEILIRVSTSTLRSLSR